MSTLILVFTPYLFIAIHHWEHLRYNFSNLDIGKGFSLLISSLQIMWPVTSANWRHYIRCFRRWVSYDSLVFESISNWFTFCYYWNKLAVCFLCKDDVTQTYLFRLWIILKTLTASSRYWCIVVAYCVYRSRYK